MTLPEGISWKITCTDVIFLYVSPNYCLILIKQSIHLAVLCPGNWYMIVSPSSISQISYLRPEAKEGKSHTVTSHRVRCRTVAHYLRIDYTMCRMIVLFELMDDLCWCEQEVKMWIYAIISCYHRINTCDVVCSEMSWTSYRSLKYGCDEIQRCDYTVMRDVNRTYVMRREKS